MNLSGNAVRYWMQKEKIDMQHILVLVDDLSLPFGTLRLRARGSAGGHNGLKNIQDLLSSEAYARLRFGIGNEFSRGAQVDYVLGEWSAEEIKLMPERLNIACDIIKSFCLQGVERTMNAYNKK
jgi:PTH1 family peptidyl-tRNA hydrolase